MSELSVILISKEQEWNIARLVESVLRETAAIPATEIVLVDSASTDQTTQIASRYPISVFKLKPDQHLSASAGRYVGYKQTAGDLVLFLDGDMELCKGWLEQALHVMHSRSDVAVVCGQVIDLPKEEAQAPDEVLLQSLNTDVDSVEVRQGGGASLYRRSVLEQVGTFNPFLYGDEEPELCLRIRHAGHRILRLPYPIVFHLDPWRDATPADALSTFLSKRRGRLFLGFGQNMRYFFGSPLFIPYLRERGWAVAPAFILGSGIIAAVVSGLTGRWEWFALWGVCLTMLIIGIAIRKRSLKRALLTLFGRLLIFEGTIRGLLLKPFDPTSYPGRYDVIQ